MTATTPAVFPDPIVVPVPRPDGLDEPYWDGTRVHELRIQRCDACGTWRWTPEWICHQCHSFDATWHAVDPVGTLFSWTRVWHPTHPLLAGSVPYLLAIVELPHAGSIRMLGNLTGPTEKPLVLGMPLRAQFEDHDDVDPAFTLVQWASPS